MVHAGLTGGIGSGKSTVARMFEQHGAVILDADRMARELTAPGGKACADIASAFGQEILTAEGAVDRPALARRVFGDGAARRTLEAILHPRIASLRSARVATIKAREGEGVVILSEAALVFEADTQAQYDRVILVTAPEDIRRRRLLEAGWDPDDIAGRMASQWPDEKKVQLADFVVNNGGDATETKLQVAFVWSRLKGEAAG